MTTAYDLLARVAQHIEEEPKRYCQDAWVLKGDEIATQDLVAPACGTVCCRAGWIVALYDGLAAPTLNPDTVEVRAYEILGADKSEYDWDDDVDVDPLSDAIHRLFAGNALDATEADPGTSEYAKAGADGLRAFAREHEAHLKARLLADVPPAQGDHA